MIPDLAPSKAPERLRWPRQRNSRILIADNMGLTLALLRIELEPRGFSVWVATDGAHARDVYRENHELIDLVLLDVELPLLDGPQTLAALQAINPRVLACFMMT